MRSHTAVLCVRYVTFICRSFRANSSVLLYASLPTIDYDMLRINVRSKAKRSQLALTHDIEIKVEDRSLSRHRTIMLYSCCVDIESLL